MTERMKALSIRQPWAWLILHAGKDIENREWGDRYPGLTDAYKLCAAGIERVGADRFLIHAGKGMTRAEYEEALDYAHVVSRSYHFPAGLTLPTLENLPRGGIVGSARLTNIVRVHPSPWFFGPIGFVLADATPLPFRPLKGALGFFEVPTDA